MAISDNVLHREFDRHHYFMFAASVSLLSFSFYVLTQKIKRYLKVGYLLHIMTIAGILLSVYFFRVAMSEGVKLFSLKYFIYLYLAIYGATLPVFAQLDARSRYQNYKLIKDKLYRYGFSSRLIEPLSWSRCQRDAIRVAAKDLGYGPELDRALKNLGFRWFHIIPRILIKNPLLLFDKNYWYRTLFVKHYRLKSFYF